MPARARRARPRPAACIAACLALAGAAGCSTSDEDPAPVACVTTSESVQRALTAAPGAVRLRGTAISECFSRSSESGEVQSLGFAVTEAAAELSAEARSGDRDATLQLGYLLGAVRRGASKTQGIHDELVRRVEQELQGVDTSSQAFLAGERAGRESG